MTRRRRAARGRSRLQAAQCRRSASGTRRRAPTTSARSASSALDAPASLTRATAARVWRRPGRDLDGDDALPWRRHALFDRQGQRDARAEAQPPQACGGQHEQIVARLRRASAAGCRDCRECSRTRRPETSLRAARSDGRCRCQYGRLTAAPRDVVEASRPRSRRTGQHERISRILALQHRADVEPLGQHRRHVLAAVNGEVDVAAEQRIFDFLDEQPLAADLRTAAPPAADRPRS